MLSTGRPLSGPFGSRVRTTLIASVLCALALLALPAFAGANGTIRVVKGGDRVLGNTTTSGYASGLSGVTFEYTTDAAKAANPASTGWTAFGATTNGSGVATQSVPAGTYYVREATAGTGFGAFGAVKSLRYSPLTSNPSADQPYAARVTITNNTTTDVSPNTQRGAGRDGLGHDLRRQRRVVAVHQRPGQRPLPGLLRPEHPARPRPLRLDRRQRDQLRERRQGVRQLAERHPQPDRHHELQRRR